MSRPIHRILIAEDDPAQGAGLARFLALSGHDVRIARDGREVEQILRKYEPDVMILDLNLPEVDGWTLARRVRLNPAYKRPLLIALSGYNGEAYRERSREAGFDYHLAKPTAPSVLLDLIERRTELSASDGRLEEGTSAWLTN